MLDFDKESISKNEIKHIYWHSYWLIINDKEEEYKEVNKELVFNKKNDSYKISQDIDAKLKNGDKITMIIDVSISNKESTERKRLKSKHKVYNLFGPFFLV